MFHTFAAWPALVAGVEAQAAEGPPLLDPARASAIAEEVSGSAAKRTVQALLAREAGGDLPSFHYEALNRVDGRRTVQQIRDDLAASLGPVPIEEVAQYLATLARPGAIEPIG